MTPLTEVPHSAKNSFFGGAIAVGITAALGNVGHVYEAARHARQGERMAGVYAVLPDVLLVLCLLKLKYERKSPWAWAGLVASIGFITWAGLVTSTGVHPGTAGDLTARAVSIWLLVVAVIAAGLIETRSTEASPAQKSTGPAAGKPRRKAPKATPGHTESANDPAALNPPVEAEAPGAGASVPPPVRPLHVATEADQPEVDPLLPRAREAAKAICDRGESVTKVRLMAELKTLGTSIGDRRALDLLRLVKDVA